MLNDSSAGITSVNRLYKLEDTEEHSKQRFIRVGEENEQANSRSGCCCDVHLFNGGYVQQTLCAQVQPRLYSMQQCVQNESGRTQNMSAELSNKPV
ncbi:hypothetical protein PHET_06079 [Paragonimus heterotremus]|uniref:Uncharacterized protein n=1 Tax=Paragonimus heterotremus TaxID=100268 RepID=A0A8J4SNW3_9TREM|nr:hypothetical protein PHET_06079 [Paragonimus heterotremus]